MGLQKVGHDLVLTHSSYKSNHVASFWWCFPGSSVVFPYSIWHTFMFSRSSSDFTIHLFKASVSLTTLLAPGRQNPSFLYSQNLRLPVNKLQNVTRKMSLVMFCWEHTMPIYLADTPICLVCVLRKSDLNLAGLPLLENRPLCIEDQLIVPKGETWGRGRNQKLGMNIHTIWDR